MTTEREMAASNLRTARNLHYRWTARKEEAERMAAQWAREVNKYEAQLRRLDKGMAK